MRTSRLTRDDAQVYTDHVQFVSAFLATGSKVLDAGCGVGWSSDLFAEPGYDATCTSTLYLTTAYCTLPIVMMLRQVMRALSDLSQHPGMVASLAEAVLLPYACWLISWHRWACLRGRSVANP